MAMMLQRFRIRLSLGLGFSSLAPLFVVLIAEEFMVHVKIPHRGHVVEFLELLEYVPQAIPVGSRLAKSRDQACGTWWHRCLLYAVVTCVGNNSDASAKLSEFPHGGLDDKVDEAHLAGGDIRGFPIHQHRNLHVHATLEVPLCEKFPENEIRPPLAHVPVTARVRDVGNMQCLPKEKDLAIGT